MTRETMIELGYIPKPLNVVYMKLEFYNPQTLAKPKKMPDCHMVLRNNGSVAFTQPSIEQLKLKEGDKWMLCHNVDTKEVYLLQHSNGFKLKKMGGGQIGFTCKELIGKLWPGDHNGKKSFRYVITSTPMNYEGTEYYLMVPAKA